MTARLFLAVATALLAACGQTGDLYLPESRQGEVVTRPPAEASSPSSAPPASAPPATTTPANAPGADLPQPANPAPEVAAPAGTPDSRKSDKKNGTPPKQ